MLGQSGVPSRRKIHDGMTAFEYFSGTVAMRFFSMLSGVRQILSELLNLILETVFVAMFGRVAAAFFESLGAKSFHSSRCGDDIIVVDEFQSLVDSQGEHQEEAHESHKRSDDATRRGCRWHGGAVGESQWVILCLTDEYAIVYW